MGNMEHQSPLREPPQLVLQLRREEMSGVRCREGGLTGGLDILSDL